MMLKKALLARTALTATVGVLLLAAAPAEPVAASPHGKDHPQGHAPIPAQVLPPKVKAPGPLAHKAGSVAVQRRPNVAPKAKAATASAAAITTTNPVTLRALVVGLDTADWGVDTWKATLDRVGAAYDVLYTKTAALTSANLVGTDGVGKYNAILLTSSSLLYDSGGGNFVSGLDGTEWNTLWAYERDYNVRQAALYTSYGTFPEDYCLSPSTEGGVGDTPLTASLTTTGAGVFDYLKPAAQIGI